VAGGVTSAGDGIQSLPFRRFPLPSWSWSSCSMTILHISLHGSRRLDKILDGRHLVEIRLQLVEGRGVYQKIPQG
jgi:hypothetical protein